MTTQERSKEKIVSVYVNVSPFEKKRKPKTWKRKGYRKWNIQQLVNRKRRGQRGDTLGSEMVIDGETQQAHN